MVRERARDAEIVEREPGCILHVSATEAAPFALRATLYTQGNGQVAEVAMWLVTSIPRALPRLVVRHETPRAVRSARRSGSSTRSRSASRRSTACSSSRARRRQRTSSSAARCSAQLLALSRFDIPTLDVDPTARTASLRWRFEPAPKALDAAVRDPHARSRASRPSVRFRNE